MAVKVQISNKPIAGGYSFSASSDIITLTESAKDMSEPEYENLVAEATLARDLYIKYNEESKASGKKESPATMKAKAVANAKAALAPTKKRDNPLVITEVSPKKETPVKEQIKAVSAEMSDPLFDVLAKDDSISLLDVAYDVATKPDASPAEDESDEDVSLGDFDFGNPFDED